MAYESVAAVVDAARTGAWDIAFLGADPARAGEIGFTAAYLELEATYLVPAGSRLRVMAEVDQEGVRVAAPARAAYELFLSRSLQHATLVRAPSAEAAVDLLVAGKVEALAGLRQSLVGLAATRPGSRMLDGRFMAVQQAVGMPAGRDPGLPLPAGIRGGGEGLGAGRPGDRADRGAGRVGGAPRAAVVAAEPGPA